MASMQLGVGLRVIVYFVLLALIVGTSLFVGMRLERAAGLKSNVQVLKNDSIVAHRIQEETAALKQEAENNVQKLDTIVDDNGYLSPEFMQLMESAKSVAERRGNKTDILHAVTEP